MSWKIKSVLEFTHIQHPFSFQNHIHKNKEFLVWFQLPDLYHNARTKGFVDKRLKQLNYISLPDEPVATYSFQDIYKESFSDPDHRCRQKQDHLRMIWIREFLILFAIDTYVTSHRYKHLAHLFYPHKLDYMGTKWVRNRCICNGTKPLVFEISIRTTGPNVGV